MALSTKSNETENLIKKLIQYLENCPAKEREILIAIFLSQNDNFDFNENSYTILNASEKDFLDRLEASHD